MTKQDHLNYLNERGEFTFACNQIIFDESELALIIRYGHWFEGLQNGDLVPLNEEQKRFVLVANFKEKPISTHEKVWFKYLKRMEIEAKSKDTLYKEPSLNDDTFYSRKMAKQMKKQVFGVISSAHKK